MKEEDNYKMDKHIELRYSHSSFNSNLKDLSLPFLRYIVPFSFGQNDINYVKAKNKMLTNKGWKIATRSNLAPSREEDLYNHIYGVFLDKEETSLLDSNAGIVFMPIADEIKRKNMVYIFSNNGVTKKYYFYITQTSLYLFKTGVGFYVYETVLPIGKSDTEEENVVEKLTLEEFSIFQNRIKELNSIRGFLESGDNNYRIIPVDHNPKEFYTLAEDITRKLNELIGEVYFYPPRVNSRLKEVKRHELSLAWNEVKKDYKNRGIDHNEKKYKKRHAKFEEKRNYWSNISIDEISKEDVEGIKIVPDKAILFSYVVMNTPEEITEAKANEKYFNEYIKYAYYLTRGYKESYRVAPNAEHEKKGMYERHENDYWDASLEGVGNYILIYDDLYDVENETKQKYNYFLDTIRTKEMMGDYFILYMLLLYQHYSIVYFQQKISENTPMLGRVLDKEEIEKSSYVIEQQYERLHDIKFQVDTFFASSMYEAVSQITDLCNIYTYIEDRLQINKNAELLQRGISNIDRLLSERIEEKEEQKRKKIEKVTFILEIFAVFSIIADALQLIQILDGKFSGIWSVLCTKQAIISLIGIVVVLALIVVLKYFIKKKKDKK